MRFPSEVCGIRLLRGCLSLLLLLSASALHAQQQPVDPRGVVPQGMLEPLVLSGAMLVHAGDDPAYASPTLDDSGWPVLDKTHMLSSVGIEQPHNVWYRTHVHLPPGQKHLALLMRYFTGPFEVYVNGVAIGLTRRSGVGENGADLSLSYDQVAAIPDDLVRTGDLVIAIRSPLHLDKIFRVRNAGFTSQTALGLGDLTLLQSLATFHLIHVQAAPSVNALFTAIILVIAVALAFALRAQREYLALSLFLAAQLLALLLDLGLILWSQSPTRLSIFAGNLLILAEVLFALEFVRLILGVGRTRLLRAYTAVMAVVFPLLALYQVAAFDSPHMHPWTSSLVNLLYGLLLAPVILLLPLYALWRWWKTRSTDVLLLSIPLLIRGCFELILLAVSALFRSVSFQLPLDVFAVDWDDVTTFLFLLSLLVFLILRTVRVARAQSRSAAEMAAASNHPAAAPQPLFPGNARLRCRKHLSPRERGRRRFLPRLAQCRRRVAHRPRRRRVRQGPHRRHARSHDHGHPAARNLARARKHPFRLERGAADPGRNGLHHGLLPAPRARRPLHSRQRRPHRAVP